jgi:hypothetical protein
MSVAATPSVLVCCAALLVNSAAVVHARPQEQGAVACTSIDKVKEGVLTPIVTPLAPSVPVRLRPVFKSGVEKHPFVLTLEEDLHKTFELTDFQRRAANWSAQCCGLNLAQIYGAIKQAQAESQVRKAREQVLRELADLDSARSAAGIIK